MMHKVPKLALILEPDPAASSFYNGALESSGYVVRTCHEEKDFFAKALNMLPDVLVVNGTHSSVNEEAICKKVKKHTVLREASLVLLVEKLGFAAKAKGEKLKADALEVFPLQNKKFLQTMKKVTKNFFIPEVVLNGEHKVEGHLHAELLEISENKFTFSAPAKLANHANIEITSKLLQSFGVVGKNFEADINGSYLEAKLYKNEVEMRGLSVEVLRELKRYCSKNREKK